MSTKGLRPDQLTFRAYPKAFTLIPLFRCDAVSTHKGRARKDGKRPLHFNWTKRDYARDAVLRLAGKGHNVGVRLTATQLVVDVDPRNGGDRGWPALCADLGIDPTQYPTVITGSGGLHVYMSKPANVPVVDTLESYPGVEFKSKGRQVLAAGCIHPDSLKPYAFDDFSPSIDDGAPLAPVALIEAIQRPEPSGEVTGGGQYDQEGIARALARLEPEDFADHDKWLRLMMACHHASNGDARQEWIDWSTSDPTYADDAEIIGRRWDSLHKEKSDGVTYRTLNKYLAEAGAGSAQAAPEVEADEFGDVDESADADTTDDDVPSVTSRGLATNKQHVAVDNYPNALAAINGADVRPEWDELKGQVVFRQPDLPWNASYGRVLNDHVERLIRLYLTDRYQGITYSPSREHLHEALMTMAYGRKFNPVLEYLDSLQWDGMKRVASLFGGYFGCKNDAFTRAVSVCFAVAAVRRMREPGCKFDNIPIIKGRQGVGKSSGLKALFGAEWFSDAELGDLKGKDAALLLRGIWCHESSELGAMTNAAAETLKAFLSRGTDRIREPYGRNVEDVPRRCVSAGTTNEGGYLRDATGARRFWPLEVLREIDVAGITADRDQLWAEAAAMEAAGESLVLPRELWGDAARKQEAATEDDPWVDLIRQFLEARKAAHERGTTDDDMDDGDPLPPDRVLTGELFEALHIEERDRTRSKAQRLRTVMEARLMWQHAGRNIRVGAMTGKGYTAP